MLWAGLDWAGLPRRSALYKANLANRWGDSQPHRSCSQTDCKEHVQVGIGQYTLCLKVHLSFYQTPPSTANVVQAGPLFGYVHLLFKLSPRQISLSP